MIQATATMAKLIVLDKLIMKDFYAENKLVIFNIIGVSPDETQAYQGIMEAK